MLAVLFSWIITTFILFSWGDMAIKLYNTWSKCDEQYNGLDAILLGLCFLAIPLSIWSLWLPANHIFLFFSFVISAIYWICNRKRLSKEATRIKSIVKALSQKELSFITILFLLILISCSWVEGIFDSLYYHHQNILWNEMFAIVPGLGNLDDKFAFNSSYLLLSSPFTFRFLFDEALYPIIPLFFIYISAWIIHELFRSRFEAKRVFIFCSYIVFYIMSINFIFDTSTDLLPNLFIFYIIAKIILYPDYFKQNWLLGFILPVFMITCKISVFPIILLTLYILAVIIKQKNYRPLIFLLFFSGLITVTWLIRNVILSGYLVYPVYQIDLFSFDWKIPQYAAIQAKEYILFIGLKFFNFIIDSPFARYRDPFWINILTILTYLLVLISFFRIVYLLIKQKIKIPALYIIAFVCLTLIIIIWAINGPDFRFVSGVMYIYIALAASLTYLKSEKRYRNLSISVIAIFIAFTTVWTFRRMYYAHKTVTHSEAAVKPRPFYTIFVKPYTRECVLDALDSPLDSHFTPVEINNGIILYSSDLNITYEKLPAIVPNHASRTTHHDCIEARGKSLQDGFRTKKDCK